MFRKKSRVLKFADFMLNIFPRHTLCFLSQAFGRQTLDWDDSVRAAREMDTVWACEGTMTRLWDMWHEWCSRRPDTAAGKQHCCCDAQQHLHCSLEETWTRRLANISSSKPKINFCSLLLMIRSQDDPEPQTQTQRNTFLAPNCSCCCCKPCVALWRKNNVTPSPSDVSLNLSKNLIWFVQTTITGWSLIPYDSRHHQSVDSEQEKGHEKLYC